jgi:ppGpp synthetase/RelA/SpoT-type nucleotidyltranferase
MIEKHPFELGHAVEELFGKNVVLDEAKRIIEKKIKSYRHIQPYIFDELNEFIDTYEQDKFEEAKRHAAELMKTEKYQIKSPESIIEKIWRSKRAKEVGKSKIQQYTIDNFEQTMGDILRFRVLCNYLCDMFELSDRLPEFLLNRDFSIDDGPKDFINIEPGGRKKGYRAVHFVFKKAHEGTEYLFEVQIMTLLQHAWDKKDHHLVYEYRRINKEIPLDLKMRSYAMSELLFIADNFFDSLLGT